MRTASSRTCRNRRSLLTPSARSIAAASSGRASRIGPSASAVVTLSQEPRRTSADRRPRRPARPRPGRWRAWSCRRRPPRPGTPAGRCRRAPRRAVPPGRPGNPNARSAHQPFNPGWPALAACSRDGGVPGLAGREDAGAEGSLAGGDDGRAERCGRDRDGGQITVRVAGHATEVTVEVTDTGPGVPPPDRERLRALRPARRQRSGGAEGNGLGLAIARGIATAHSGTLTCTGRAAWRSPPGAPAAAAAQAPRHLRSGPSRPWYA